MKLTKIIFTLTAAMLTAVFTGCDIDEGGASSPEKRTNDLSTAKLKIETIDIPGKTVQCSPSYVIWDDKGIFYSANDLSSITVNDFSMCKYEVTKAQYNEIMSDAALNTLGLEADPSRTNDPDRYPIASGEINGDRPVENITWYDAVYFCNLRSSKDGYTAAYSIDTSSIKVVEGHITQATVTNVSGANGWRLPTETEWEFAARGGDPSEADWNYVYSGANSQYTSAAEALENKTDSGVDKVGWYSRNIEKADFNPGNCTHECGKKTANRLGIYDMSGNVSEWCDQNVIRGGCCYELPPELTVTRTNYTVSPGTRNPSNNTIILVGFRMVRTK